MKKLIFSIICMILLVSSSFVIAEVASGGDLWHDYIQGYFEDVRDFDVTDVSYNEPPSLNWYPVAPWEEDQCSKDLSTEFFLDAQDESLDIEVDNKVYALTIALNPELQQTFFTDEDGKSQQLFTMGWYIQGIPSTSGNGKVKYSIKLQPGNIDVNLGGGETEKEFTLSTGTSGFYSNYTIKCPTKAVLKIQGDQTKTYEETIIRIDLLGSSNSELVFCESDRT